MNPVFADTYYYLALANPKDLGHGRAKAFAMSSSRPMVTTSWVVTELADALSRVELRDIFAKLYTAIMSSPLTTCIEADQSLMNRGLALYTSRVDKNWSLTDCISFVVMQERCLNEVLTADHHFEQAGYTLLLKS